MKKLIMMAVVLAIYCPLNAQWTTNPTTNDAHNNNQSGKVGIGTTTPTLGRLQVSQASDASDQGIAILNSTGVRALRLWTDVNNSYLYSGGTGQGPLILNSTGYVGIGTTSPGDALHVVKTGSNQLVLQDISSASQGVGGGIRFLGYTNGTSGINDFATIQGVKSNNSGGGILKLFTGTNQGYSYERLRIDENGNVGIGTTSPWDALHVAKAGSNQLVLQDLSSANDGVGGGMSFSGYTNGTSGVNYFATIQGVKSSSSVGGVLKILTSDNIGNSYERLRIDNMGSVGIGTPSPQYRLDVVGNASVSNGLDVEGYVNLSEGRLTQSGNIPNDNNAAFSNTSSTGYGLFSQAGGTGKYAFHFLNQQGSSILYGRSDGNVGIGTASPVDALNVAKAGNNQLVLQDLSTAVDGVGGGIRFMGYTNGTTGANYFATIQGVKAPSTAGGIFKVLTSDNVGNIFERLRIDNFGNVGIGTTSPDAKLTVKGIIHAEELKIDLNIPVPDYVFEPNYKLLSLEEIKTYIDQHKHLPEVPSAKEMETNGVNVSEMNMLLLKKIEELTLYQIEATKKIESLVTKVKELESKIN